MACGFKHIRKQSGSRTHCTTRQELSPVKAIPRVSGYGAPLNGYVYSTGGKRAAEKMVSSAWHVIQLPSAV
jgi:hypothetical protein